MNSGGQGAAIAVVGAGPVGASAALVAAARGFQVHWYRDATASTTPRPTERLVTLSARSIHLLGDLGLWNSIASQARPVYGMEVVVQDGPVLDLGLSGGGVHALAQTIRLAALQEALVTAPQFQPRIQIHGQWNRQVAKGYQLLLGADGPQSPVRHASRIGWSHKEYHQTGWTGLFRVSQPRPGVAHQWFRPGEVLALLPTLQDDVVSVVHSLSPHQPGDALWRSAVEDPEALARHLSLQVHGRLGILQPILQDVTGRFQPEQAPLRLGAAERQAHGQTLLLGDAAHRVHPLAGLGLNLGLADVDALGQQLALALQTDPRLTSRPDAIRMALLAERVARSRALDSRMRQIGIDLIHQFFVSDRSLPPWLLQTGALALRAIPELRQGLALLGSGQPPAPIPSGVSPA